MSDYFMFPMYNTPSYNAVFRTLEREITLPQNCFKWEINLNFDKITFLGGTYVTLDGNLCTNI